MQNFYKMSAKPANNATDDKNNRYYDEEGKFKWEAQSSSEDEDGEEEDDSDIEKVVKIKPSKVEMGDNSDEEEGGDDIWSIDSENEDNIKKVSDKDIKIGKRLALTDLDWDNLNATDILAIFTSLCKGGDMFITKV